MPEPTAQDGASADISDDVRQAIRILQHHSDAMLNLGQMIDQGAQSMGWHCSKATRYRDAASMHRVDARRLAAELLSLARSLQDEAVQVNVKYSPNLFVPRLDLSSFHSQSRRP